MVAVTTQSPRGVTTLVPTRTSSIGASPSGVSTGVPATKQWLWWFFSKVSAPTVDFL